MVMFSFLKNIKDILNCLGYDKTRVRIQGEEVTPYMNTSISPEDVLKIM